MQTEIPNNWIGAGCLCDTSSLYPPPLLFTPSAYTESLAIILWLISVGFWHSLHKLHIYTHMRQKIRTHIQKRKTRQTKTQQNIVPAEYSRHSYLNRQQRAKIFILLICIETTGTGKQHFKSTWRNAVIQ